MTQRSRKIVLTIFLGLFILIGPATVLYAYGWRWDFRAFRLIKVGGIFLRSLPADAQVQIDRKPLENQTRDFLSGELIGNLLPGIYHVQVTKPGFRPWEKDFPVTPANVSESKPIVLVPDRPEETALIDRPILDFWVNDSKLVYRDQNGEYFITDVTSPKARTNLGILFNNLKQRLLAFPGWVGVSDIAPTDSQNQWIIATGKTDYLLDIKKLSLEILKKHPPAGRPPLPPDHRLPDRQSVKYASAFKDPDHLLVQYPNKVFLLELDDREPLNLQLVAAGVLKHAYNKGRLYLLRSTGLSYIEI